MRRIIRLTVPGLGSSGDEHWQTLWEKDRADCRRAELGDWDHPDRDRWVAALARAIRQLGEAPLIVAHSLGCLAVVWWASRFPCEAGRIVGALLVAPPDVDAPDADPRLTSFAPAPRQALPFPAIVVASRTDPYAAFERSRGMAEWWSAAIHDAGDAGHLNAASGLGSWPEGQRLVARLRAEAAERRSPSHGAGEGRRRTPCEPSS